MFYLVIYILERKKKICISFVYIIKSVICVKFKVYDIKIKIKKISVCDIVYLICLRILFIILIVFYCFLDIK